MKISIKSAFILSIALILFTLTLYPNGALSENGAIKPIQSESESNDKPASEQDLDSILENYQNAIGGKEAWEKMEGLKVSGNMHSLGTVFKTEVVYERPNKCRLDFRAQNMYFAEAYDGVTPWQIGIAMKTQEPKELEGKRAQELIQTCDFDGPLIDHEKKDIKIEYEGLEEIDDNKGYRLKVTYKNGSVDTYFLDEETYLPFLVLSTTTVKNRSLKSTTRMGDFIETGDIKIAYYYEFELEGVPQNEKFNVTSVQIDPEIKKDFFSMPRNVKDSY